MKICCIKTERLPSSWTVKTGSLAVDFFSYIDEADLCWVERSEAEIDASYKQIIPYIVVQNDEGRLLSYLRVGGEARLHGLYSCGIGGHIDQGDCGATIQETVAAGLARELSEEISNFEPRSISLEYRGIINDADTPVGKVHLGLVYLARCAPGFTPSPGEELKGMEWKTRDELRTLAKESWADLAVSLI